jgi:hypothetical protein
MVIPEITVTENDKVGEFKYYTLGSIKGVKTIRALPDDDVWALTVDDSPEFNAMMDHMGRSTNPAWIGGTAIEILYERRLIDERKMDHMRDDWGL